MGDRADREDLGKMAAALFIDLDKKSHAQLKEEGYRGCIVTNPPYMLANEFTAHALELCRNVVMLLRLAFLETERRSPILDGAGLRRVFVFRKRLPMMHRDGWEGRKATHGLAFAWFVWSAAIVATR